MHQDGILIPEVLRRLGEVLSPTFNAATDGSPEIAEAEGPDSSPVQIRGYGATPTAGIDNARGRYVVMGDADQSYDLSDLMPFLEQLRNGADLVMGNRFKGGIAPGAMPFSHKYIGNPVLSKLGRMFFSSRSATFIAACAEFGATGFAPLRLLTTGMEFASEMVVKSALAGYKITEVPTTSQRMVDRDRHICALGTMVGGISGFCSCTAHNGCSCIPDSF